MNFGGPSYVVRMEDVRNTYRILVWKPLVKRSFEEPRIKENRIKLKLHEAGWEDGRDWLRSCPMAKFGISSIRERHWETVN